MPVVWETARASTSGRPTVSISLLKDVSVRTHSLLQSLVVVGALAAIDHLRDTKYATWEWNFGHSPRYNFSKRARTPGGTVEATIEVTDGIIRAAHFYGDYFTRGDPAELAAALVGTPHREDALRERLNTLAVERYFVNVTAEDLTTVLLLSLIHI